MARGRQDEPTRQRHAPRHEEAPDREAEQAPVLPEEATPEAREAARDQQQLGNQALLQRIEATVREEAEEAATGFLHPRALAPAFDASGGADDDALLEFLLGGVDDPEPPPARRHPRRVRFRGPPPGRNAGGAKRTPPPRLHPSGAAEVLLGWLPTRPLPTRVEPEELVDLPPDHALCRLAAAARWQVRSGEAWAVLAGRTVEGLRPDPVLPRRLARDLAFLCVGQEAMAARWGPAAAERSLAVALGDRARTDVGHQPGLVALVQAALTRDRGPWLPALVAPPGGRPSPAVRDLVAAALEGWLPRPGRPRAPRIRAPSPEAGGDPVLEAIDATLRGGPPPRRAGLEDVEPLVEAALAAMADAGAALRRVGAATLAVRRALGPAIDRELLRLLQRTERRVVELAHRFHAAATEAQELAGRPWEQVEAQGGRLARDHDAGRERLMVAEWVALRELCVLAATALAAPPGPPHPAPPAPLVEAADRLAAGDPVPLAPLERLVATRPRRCPAGLAAALAVQAVTARERDATHLLLRARARRAPAAWVAAARSLHPEGIPPAALPRWIRRHPVAVLALPEDAPWPPTAPTRNERGGATRVPPPRGPRLRGSAPPAPPCAPRRPPPA